MFHKHKEKFIVSLFIFIGIVIVYTLFTFTDRIIYYNNNEESTKIEGLEALLMAPKTLSQKGMPSRSLIPGKNVRQNCLVLGYHSINDRLIYPEFSSLYVYPSEFEKQIKYLKENNYTPINFDQLDELEAVEKELSESKGILSKITGKSVDALAYPCCDYNEKVAAIAKKYYKYAITTYSGLYKVGSNNQSITRTYVGRTLKMDNFKSGILCQALK